jgi:hypothetical protein
MRTDALAYVCGYTRKNLQALWGEVHAKKGMAEVLPERLPHLGVDQSIPH